MSSTYKVLCLSHDPAMVADDSAHDEATALGILAEYRADPASAHHGCDLVVGRYSYPLMEVTCPGCRNRGYHPRPHRSDADVLRYVLHGLQQAAHSETHNLAIRAASICWTLDRLGKLRNELG